MHGYHGRYLRIDVSRGTGEWVPLSDDVLARFIGGVGLGVWLIHREAPPGVEPLAPEAPLLFAFSPQRRFRRQRKRRCYSPSARWSARR